MRSWTLSYLKKWKYSISLSWPSILTSFKDTDPGLTGKSGFDQRKHLHFTILIPILLLRRFLCNFVGSPKKTRRREFGRKEFEFGPDTLASWRSTHSSHNIKKSGCLSFSEKNDSSKGFAIPHVHVPFWPNFKGSFLGPSWVGDICPDQAFNFSLNSTSCTMFDGLMISSLFSWTWPGTWSCPPWRSWLWPWWGRPGPRRSQWYC